MRPTRVVAIVNLNGGTAKALGETAVRANLEAAFAGKHFSAEIVLVRGSRQIAKQVRKARARAKRKEVDVVAIGGGDGTIRTAVSVLAGTGTAVAILPLGTMNHFAKALGVPLDLTAAAGLIDAFNLADVDVGEVNGEVFINNSSIGIYPFMVADREKRIAKGEGKWSAAVFAALRILDRFPRHHLLVSTRGHELRRLTPCLFVGNNKYDTNFFSLGRDHLDAGKLYLYVVKPRTAPLVYRTRPGELKVVVPPKA